MLRLPTRHFNSTLWVKAACWSRRSLLPSFHVFSRCLTQQTSSSSSCSHSSPPAVSPSSSGSSSSLEGSSSPPVDGSTLSTPAPADTFVSSNFPTLHSYFHPPTSHSSHPSPPASASSISLSPSPSPSPSVSDPDVELPFRIVSTPTLPHRVIVSNLGLVAATAFRSRSLFYDILIAFGKIFGGETYAYRDLVNECVEKATSRLIETAQAQGATAIVNVRYMTAPHTSRLIVGLHVYVTATGTAVIDELKPKPKPKPKPSASPTNNRSRSNVYTYRKSIRTVE